MRLIALDTSLLLPGLLSAAGQRRRLLVVLAYGAASYYARFGEDEAAALEQLAERSDTEPRGLPISDKSLAPQNRRRNSRSSFP